MLMMQTSVSESCVVVVFSIAQTGTIAHLCRLCQKLRLFLEHGTSNMDNPDRGEHVVLESQSEARC